MLKTLFVQSSFKDKYKWEEVKVPTGAVKKHYLEVKSR